VPMSGALKAVGISDDRQIFRGAFQMAKDGQQGFSTCRRAAAKAGKALPCCAAATSA
jgi:hypothetical protein